MGTTQLPFVPLFTVDTISSEVIAISRDRLGATNEGFIVAARTGVEHWTLNSSNESWSSSPPDTVVEVSIDRKDSGVPDGLGIIVRDGVVNSLLSASNKLGSVLSFDFIGLVLSGGGFLDPRNGGSRGCS